MLHTINHKTKKKKRVGRGGDRGKTSGRGHKGQRSRAGRKIRPAFRDVLQRIPKKRGHSKGRSRGIIIGKTNPVAVNINTLDTRFDDGAKITPAKLLAKKLVSRQKGKTPRIKILGLGETKKKFSIHRCYTSKTAREKLEKTGSKLYN